MHHHHRQTTPQFLTPLLLALALRGFVSVESKGVNLKHIHAHIRYQRGRDTHTACESHTHRARTPWPGRWIQLPVALLHLSAEGLRLWQLLARCSFATPTRKIHQTVPKRRENCTTKISKLARRIWPLFSASTCTLELDFSELSAHKNGSQEI